MRSFVAAGFVALAAGLAATVAPAGAAVELGQSGWAWGNPLPQGNDLSALEFSTGGRGYAAGLAHRADDHLLPALGSDSEHRDRRWRLRAAAFG
jgi:hypothetical protein